MPPPKLGQVGFSLEAIEKGQPGLAVFEGEELKVQPLEDIPQYIDIIIVGLPNVVRIYRRPVRNLEEAIGTDITFLSTDTKGYFRSAIAQNTKEDANISGLQGNHIHVLAVIIQALEQLSYRVLFWTKDTFDDVDIDQDSYVDHVDLDLPNLGVQIAGAGQFYLAQRLDPPLLYIDQDETRELHVSLENLSAASKTAGADGEVKLTFAYSPLKEEI